MFRFHTTANLVCLVVAVLAYLQCQMICAADPLLGAWDVVSVKVNGQQQERKNWKVWDRFFFEDNKVVGLESGDKAATTLLERFPNRADNQPTKFDRFLKGDGGDDTLYLWARGIYSISGDKLIWCEAYPTKPRPNIFETQKGDGRMLIVLRRARKKPETGERR